MSTGEAGEGGEGDVAGRGQEVRRDKAQARRHGGGTQVGLIINPSNIIYYQLNIVKEADLASQKRTSCR